MNYQHIFPANSGSLDTPNMSDDIPWIQVTPSVMPWTMENRPQLVRFGETSGEGDPWSIPRPKIRFIKRKSDLDFNIRPAKMHITEEKMAAELKNMHISNNYVGDQVLSDGLDKPTQADCMLPTLVLSKEVQSLATFQDPLLPDSILKMQKPTRALVLWKPPRGSLTSQILSNVRNQEDEEVDTINNNAGTPHLNTMTTPRSPSLNIEMEL
uniref:Uncharacterized protein n=1 Tax=Cuerna arida TaxID=1464854 RepID=A0A1B6FLF0_9HEMI